MILPLLIAALAAPVGQPERALWVWYGEPLMQSTPARQDFFQFLSAPKSNPAAKISVIFVSRTGMENASQMKSLAEFISQAHSKQIRVDYLCGESSWAKKENHHVALTQLEDVLNFNKGAAKIGRFDGFQYDVEPYLTKGWPAPSLISSYLELLATAHKNIVRSGQSLYLGVAIPRWFDSPDLHNLHKSVIDRVDYVAVMDYVDTPERFVHDGLNEVKYATQSGKKAWLGAETSSLPEEPNATFYTVGNRVMESAFAAAASSYGGESGFAGIAIEHYDTYRTLRP